MVARVFSIRYLSFPHIYPYTIHVGHAGRPLPVCRQCMSPLTCRNCPRTRGAKLAFSYFLFDFSSYGETCRNPTLPFIYSPARACHFFLLKRSSQDKSPSFSLHRLLHPWCAEYIPLYTSIPSLHPLIQTIIALPPLPFISNLFFSIIAVYLLSTLCFTLFA